MEYGRRAELERCLEVRGEGVRFPQQLPTQAPGFTLHYEQPQAAGNAQTSTTLKIKVCGPVLHRKWGIEFAEMLLQHAGGVKCSTDRHDWQTVQ